MALKLFFLSLLLLLPLSELSASYHMLSKDSEVQIASSSRDGVIVEYRKEDDKTWVRSESIMMPLDSSDEMQRLSLHSFYVTSGQEPITPSQIYIGVFTEPCVESFQFKIWINGSLFHSSVSGSLCIARLGTTYGVCSVHLNYDEFLRFSDGQEIKIRVGKRKFQLTVRVIDVFKFEI